MWNYPRRPLVCRIYPVETNPFVQFDTANKVCPPQAWSAEHPLLQHDGRVTGEVIREDVQRWRQAGVDDVSMKLKVCAALSLADASVAHEGFLIHSPPKGGLLEALCAARDERDSDRADMQWALFTDREDTLANLAKAGANFSHPRDARSMAYQYIGLMRQ